MSTGSGSELLPRLLERIARDGPIRFDEYMALALTDPDGGFFSTGGGAGRRADFLTSVEVGPLFGTVVARALDTWWVELGHPDPFTVVDAGAGSGTLARAITTAAPTCRDALRLVLVEPSTARRADHPDGVVSTATMPESLGVAIVLANELLDNLPVRVLVREPDRWAEVFVAAAGDRLVERLMTADVTIPVPPGSTVPRPAAAIAWIDRTLAAIERGRLVVFDYCSTTAELATRPRREWLRTYRRHQRGGDPLEAPGTQDITCEVAIDQITAAHPPTLVRPQADFLLAHDLDALVDEGRREWRRRAADPDVEAMRFRSRVREAEALLDPGGLGGFTAVEWVR